MFRKAKEWLGSSRSTIWCMKYLPLIGTILMTAHAGLLIIGVDLNALEFIAGFPLSSLLMFLLLSRQFRFCILHKHLIGYVAVMDICIFMQEHDMWGKALVPARWTMFIIGVILIMWAAFKHCVQKNEDMFATCI